jgi:hypothetical protein
VGQMESMQGINLGGHPVYDRPSLSLSNLIQGNWGAALQAQFDPDKLSPHERKSIAASMGLEGTPVEAAINITTNPLVLFGLLGAMAFRWPLPTAQRLMTFSGEWPKRIIPKFFWSRFASPVSENLKNTPIPGVLREITRESHLEQKMYYETWKPAFDRFKKATGREITGTEMNLAGLVMDDTFNPGNPVWQQARRMLEESGETKFLGALNNPLKGLEGRVTPAIRQFAEDSRKLMDTIWERNFTDPVYAPRMRDMLRERAGFRLTKAEFPKRIENYFPHLRKISPEAEQTFVTRSIQRELKTKSRNSKVVRQLDKITNQSFAERTGAMLPDPDVLEELGVDPQVVSAIEAAASRTADGDPLFYGLDYGKTIQRHIASVARARAWTRPVDARIAEKGFAAKSYGQELKDSLYRLRDTEGGLHDARVLADTIVPQMMGGMGPQQANMSLWWQSQKTAAAELLNSKVAKKFMPEKTRQSIKRFLLYDESATIPGIGSTIAGHMYTATLAAPNLVPSMLNLLQPMTTVAPLVGPKVFGKGYANAGRKMLEYLKLRKAGLGLEEAVEKAMPEFAKAALELDPTARQEVMQSLEHAAGGMIGALKGNYTKITDKLMTAFSHTEMFNRLVAFESGLLKAGDDLLGQKVWNPVLGRAVEVTKKNLPEMSRQFATEMTYMTQFGGGVLESPYLTQGWWAPFRQFTTFPLRMAGLLTGPMARNPGYMSQAMLTTGLAYGVGKEVFGTDLSRGLMFGGLPAPSEYGAFAPYPFSTPTLQIIGGAATGLATGDFEELQRTAPLLVPGGVGMARLVGDIPGGEGVAQFIGRRYADYDNMTPDGKVPVYSADQALIGYYSPQQMIAKAMGLGDVTTGRERAVTQWLQAQREQIRGAKQEMMNAALEGDALSVVRMQQKFERRYPGMGGIPMSPSDARAVHMRMDVSRIERMLETMPADMRPDFSAAVAVSMGAAYPEFMGLMEPGLLGGQTVNLRDPYRRNPMSRRQEQVNQGLQGVKMRDRLRQEGMMKPGDSGEYFGQSAFGR